MEPLDPDNAGPDTRSGEPSPDDSETSGSDGADSLSPSVRRLARQYSLDVTQIAGTGPGGRVRLADVMACLGARESRDGEAERATAAPNDTREREARAGAPLAARAGPEASVFAPVTNVFECDMTAALVHRKLMLSRKIELSLTSYYAFACTAALTAVPEVNGGRDEVNMGVALTDEEGNTVVPVIHRMERCSLGSINEQLRALHRAVRAGELPERARAQATFVLFHHGLTGSLLATPTPLDNRHAGSLGVGKLRRQVAVQNVSGQEGPRIAPLCYVSLSFDPGRLCIHRANRFLSHFVETLENWPQEA